MYPAPFKAVDNHGARVEVFQVGRIANLNLHNILQIVQLSYLSFAAAE